MVRDCVNSLELEQTSIEYPEVGEGWNCFLTFVYSNGREERIVYFDDEYVRNTKRPWGWIKNTGSERLKDVLERVKK